MPSILAISAHAADFVWRCGGTLALYRRGGWSATVITLTFGERGESGAAWSAPGATEQSVKAIRRAEAEAAASDLGVALAAMDWGDYPLVVDEDRLAQLVALVRRIRPEVVMTHAPRDLMNPDHPVAYTVTERALRLASVPGYQPETPPIGPLALFCFEPDQPELGEFNPDTYIDIGEVYQQKVQAMGRIATQQNLVDPYRARAAYRGYLASRFTSQPIINAEAFQRVTPFVGSRFPAQPA